MRTRQEMCVFILGLMAILLVVSAGNVLAQQAADANHSAAAAAGAAPQAADQGGVTGEWQGMLSRYHLTVKIEQSAGPGLTGTLTFVDQKVTVPFDKVSLSPDRVLRLEVRNGAAVIEGKLSDNGAEINGTWQESGNAAPLVLRRPGATASAPTLKPRTLGRVALQPCRTPDGNTEGLCGKYEVYENRQSQSGRKIALNIMVLPAISGKPAADPFFALAGGPGQSAVEAYPLVGFVTRVRQNRDVVLIDQRGTGASNPLPCELRDAKDAQSIFGEYVPMEKVRSCRAELEKKADLTQYTTSIFADDLDEVRQAMGYGKINIFGGSYGSRSALVYLRQHADQVRTLTLEGIAPPDYRVMLAFPRTIQSSVDQVIGLCAADDACHKDFPNLKKEFQELVDRLDKSPAHFEVDTASGKQAIILSRGSFVANLRPFLYVPALVSQFPYTIHRAYQGDWSIFGSVAVSLRGELEKALDRGLSISVICAEDVPGVTDAIIQRETRGTYLGDYQVRMYRKACQEWPRGTVPQDFHAAIHSAVPALLISGALDPATPPSQSEQTAHDLTNSRRIIVKEGTHGTGSPCIDGLISQFVDQGSGAGLDTSCVDKIHLPPFVTQTQVDKAQAAGHRP
ncbi:MAG TPA: alpha/beta hydrolase [Candidatus Angelobacter sp.]